MNDPTRRGLARQLEQMMTHEARAMTARGETQYMLDVQPDGTVMPFIRLVAGTGDEDDPFTVTEITIAGRPYEPTGEVSRLEHS